MSEPIDNLMRDMGEKDDALAAMAPADKGIIIVPGDTATGWQIRMFGMSWRDMAFAMLVAQSLLQRNLLDDEEDDGGE